MNTFTDEQKKISNRNRDKLRKELGIKGDRTLVLHHKDTTMKFNNVDRYIEWNKEDVEVMTLSDHTKLHCQLFMNEEYKQNMSEMKKGQTAWNKGKHFKCTKKRRSRTEDEKQYTSELMKNIERTDEWKANISKALKGRKGSATGKHWFNNGVTETYDFNCPDGYVKGRLKRG